MTPELLIAIIAFAHGAVIGSFLNVVIWRVPRGESIVRPPSKCPKCADSIPWYLNVPIASWLFLRGRCRRCGAPFGLRYPVVELLTALLAVACVKTFGLNPLGVRAFVFVAILVTLTYIDLDHWLLPHAITWPGIVVGLATAGLPGGPGWLSSAIGAGGGYGAFWLVRVVGTFVFKREAMGGGDLFLLSMIGAFLGWKLLLPVVFLASIQGSVVGVVLLLLKPRVDVEEEDSPAGPVSPDAGSLPLEVPPEVPPEGAAEAGEADEEAEEGEDDEEWVPPAGAVPFGPFLALAALEALFVGDTILAWARTYLGLG